MRSVFSSKSQAITQHPSWENIKAEVMLVSPDNQGITNSQFKANDKDNWDGLHVFTEWLYVLAVLLHFIPIINKFRKLHMQLTRWDTFPHSSLWFWPPSRWKIDNWKIKHFRGIWTSRLVHKAWFDLNFLFFLSLQFENYFGEIWVSSSLWL